MKYNVGASITNNSLSSAGTDAVIQPTVEWKHGWGEFLIFWIHFWEHKVKMPIINPPEPPPPGPEPMPTAGGSSGTHSCIQVESSAQATTMENVRVALSLKLEPNGASNQHDVELDSGDSILTVGRPDGTWVAIGITSADGTFLVDSITPVGSDPDGFSSRDADGALGTTNGSTFVVNLGTIAPGQKKQFAIKMVWGNTKEVAKWHFRNSASDPTDPCI